MAFGLYLGVALAVGAFNDSDKHFVVQYVDAEDTKSALAGSLADSSFVHNQLSQADPLSPMFQHGVSRPLAELDYCEAVKPGM